MHGIDWGEEMSKYKSSMSPRVKNMVEWQLEHYWQDKQNIERYWNDNLPSPTPKYSDGSGGGEVSRNVENTVLRISSMPYIVQTERSVKAIERVLGAAEDLDRKLISLIYWQQAYTVEGAAWAVHIGKSTAYRHINDILRKIALELGYISV